VNLGLFLTRIITAQGWYIVTYALGIYHLNLFIAFLTPKIDPGLDLDSGEFRLMIEAKSSK
jgi:Rer1 family